MKAWLKTLLTVVAGLVVIGAVFWWQTRQLAKEPAPKPAAKQQTQKPAQPQKSDNAQNPYGLVPPVADFRARITKKFFGTYVSPGNSPVSPERFTGYHTGVDVEYGDVTSDVAVHAIADGTVIYSNWVSGYGGVEILHHEINGQLHSVLYGHLRPSSLLPVGTTVSQNQQIGLLGTAYSTETDGERRNLHFAILAGSGTDLRGYVPTKSELSGWIDPLTFYPT